MTLQPTGHDAFNSGDFLALTTNDVEMRHGLLEIFLSEAPQLAERLSRALAADDPREVALAAHALRSLLASVGGRAAFHCAGEIERAAKGGDLVAAAALHGELGESTELLRTALIAFVRGEQPPC